MECQKTQEVRKKVEKEASEKLHTELKLASDKIQLLRAELNKQARIHALAKLESQKSSKTEDINGHSPVNGEKVESHPHGIKEGHIHQHGVQESHSPHSHGDKEIHSHHHGDKECHDHHHGHEHEEGHSHGDEEGHFHDDEEEHSHEDDLENEPICEITQSYRKRHFSSAQEELTELKKTLKRVEWENATFRAELKQLSGEVRGKKDAEDKLSALLLENGKMKAQLEKLEHMVIQLEGENDTIGMLIFSISKLFSQTVQD